MSADDAMSVASVASILQVYAFDPPKKVPAERLRDLTPSELEGMVRRPELGANWALIRRLKLVPAVVEQKKLPAEERAAFIARETERLDIKEKRHNLSVLVQQLQASGDWQSFEAQFPRLVGGRLGPDDRLRWQDDLEFPTAIPTSSTLASAVPSARVSHASIGVDRPSRGNPSPFSTKHGPRIPTPPPPPTMDSGALDSIPSARKFQPSYKHRNVARPVKPEVARMAVNAGVAIDPNYRGEVTPRTVRNSACPEEQNCAVFILLKPGTTDKHVFAAIHEGGIFSYSMKEPMPPKYTAPCATVTFKHRRAAQEFLLRAEETGVFIHGYRVKVQPSVNPAYGIEPSKKYQSRVLEICGPLEYLDPDEIEKAFHRSIRFKLVDRKERVEEDQKKVMFYFQSILGQSRAAYLLFSQRIKERGLKDKVAIEYAADPCDRLGWA